MVIVCYFLCTEYSYYQWYYIISYETKQFLNYLRINSVLFLHDLAETEVVHFFNRLAH